MLLRPVTETGLAKNWEFGTGLLLNQHLPDVAFGLEPGHQVGARGQVLEVKI